MVVSAVVCAVVCAVVSMSAVVSVVVSVVVCAVVSAVVCAVVCAVVSVSVVMSAVVCAGVSGARHSGSWTACAFPRSVSWSSVKKSAFGVIHRGVQVWTDRHRQASSSGQTRDRDATPGVHSLPLLPFPPPRQLPLLPA